MAYGLVVDLTTDPIGLPTDLEIETAFSHATEIANAKADRDIARNTSTEIKQAAERLAAFGLDGDSSNDSIQIVLAGAEALSPAIADRDLLSDSGIDPTQAAARLAARGLDGDSTNFEIAVALADPAALAALLIQRDLLGIYDNNKVLGFEYSSSTLSVRINLAKHIITDVAFSLDLASLKELPGIPDEIKDLIGGGGPVNVTAAATGALHIDADLDMNVKFIFDLQDVSAPKLYISDDSRLKLDLEVHNTEPLQFSAGIGFGGAAPIKLTVTDGSAHITAHIDFAMHETTDSEHRYLVNAQLWQDKPFDLAVDGDVAVNLPMYFPIESLPMGGTEADTDGDGIRDNALHMEATFTPTGLEDVKVSVPDFASSFSLFAILNNPEAVLLGLENIFGISQNLSDLFDEVGLPLVGNAFDDATQFMDVLRENLLGEKNLAGIYLNGLGQTLQQGALAGKTTIELIQEALYDKLGPGLTGNGPNLLRLQILGSDGQYTYEELTSPDQVKLVADAKHVQFNVVFQGVIFHKEIPVDFGVAVPGIELNVDAKIAIDLSYVFALGFGLDKAGIYVDTSGSAAGAEEFKLSLSASLMNPPSGAALDATLGFLQLQV
jgi:hypothetical protein